MLFERQDYQNECVDNIMEVLSNYSFKKHEYKYLNEGIEKFYIKKNIPVKDIDKIKTKLDIEMETGTGKTFTYIKTIFELHKKYKQNKFIIFVPRKAIAEGVLQNIKLTSDYFFSEYKTRLTYYRYDSNVSISAIKNHYLKNEDELSVLILINNSIDKKKTNIIHKYQEDLFEDVSIFDNLKRIKPIIIIDEPHLLKGNKFQEVFSEFNTLYFRFGATFPKDKEHKISNMVYSLDSITSFKNFLVKKIRVNTIITEKNIIKLNSLKKDVVDVLYFKDSEERKIELKVKDDIGTATGLDEYNGIYISNISVKDKKVYLSNKSFFELNDDYNIDENEIRLMIAKTIKCHFEKEEQNFAKKIKTLSLFFISNIKDFRGDNPVVKNIFEEEYKKQRKKIFASTKNKEYKNYLQKDYNEENTLLVHQGYFSGDKGNSEEQIVKGVDLILKDKEALLSFNTSLRFIFSVWALQEGWDNPNVFNICKLAKTDKEISRRQQIGRGLRICVNEDGRRQTYKYLVENENEFFKYNTLDVIVSGREKNFIEEIQKEIIDNSYVSYLADVLTADFFIKQGLSDSQNSRLKILLEDNNIIEGDKENFKIKKSIIDFIKDSKDTVIEKIKIDETIYNDMLKSLEKVQTSPIVENANKQNKIVKVRKDKLESFKILWESINKQAKIVYKNINEKNIIHSIVSKFEAEDISQVHVIEETKEYNAKDDKIEYISTQQGEKIEFLKADRYKNFVIDFLKSEKYPNSFGLELFKYLDKDKIKNNPKEAMDKLKPIIKDAIHSSLLQSISYNFESKIKITSLQNDNREYKTELKYTELGKYFNDKEAPDNYLFDTVVFDSNIEEDIILNKSPKKIDKDSITVFAKLPKISIPTPYKTYNPDFAYLIERKNNKVLFLIVEAKGYNNNSDIPESEMEKIKYAEIFFNHLQKQLPDVEIVFKKWINRTELHNIITEIGKNKNDN